MSGWRCPSCGRNDRIDVVVLVWARLVQHADGVFETSLEDAGDQDQEWAGGSLAVCRNCSSHGRMVDFEEGEKSEKEGSA